ncbi:transposase family protein [Methylobacter svalbardensis]|uniref:transposase family protein n=1 Tax=Methylobacter svalbardensis TaxID=3080016 RepID=UPI0030EE5554
MAPFLLSRIFGLLPSSVSASFPRSFTAANSRLLLHPDVLLLADSGYQGIHKHHQSSTLPVKKKKGLSLSAEDKAHNKALSKQRVFIEHINRRCKIFRIVKDVYRGKHKNYSLTWNLVAALVNLRYACI